jgi:hypothetical protein
MPRAQHELLAGALTTSTASGIRLHAAQLNHIEFGCLGL